MLAEWLGLKGKTVMLKAIRLLVPVLMGCLVVFFLPAILLANPQTAPENNPGTNHGSLPPAREKKADHPLLHNPFTPADRLGLQLSYFDYVRKATHRKEQSATLYVEKELDPFGVYAYLPYRRQSESGVRPRLHFDNAVVGAYFRAENGRFSHLYCAGLSLTTGREERRIGSEVLGNIEACTGLAVALGFLNLRARLRYNSQTNLEFQETRKRKFEQTWIGELGAELHFAPATFSLEITRLARVAPDERRFHTTIVAPGLSWQAGADWQFGMAVALTTSQERVYDRGLILKGTWLY
jgi:hypothetical protein